MENIALNMFKVLAFGHESEEVVVDGSEPTCD